MALFVDRARRADAQFALDGQELDVARLVTRLDGMPLAIELAAARVEALGVSQLLVRLDDRLELLAGGDWVAPSRQQSLAATVEWSYRLLDEHERRIFRAVSVFPGPFTLEGAEAVAGTGAGLAVLRLVDCSLLVPSQAGGDGRSRYVMLETLRAYGAQLRGEAGEQATAAAALAGYALKIAEGAATGLASSTAEVAAVRWLDAEDATIRQVLAWAMDYDLVLALRLAVALATWWLLRGRLAGEYPLLRELAGRAEAGSEEWCAAHFWLGYTALTAADLNGALAHFTAVRDANGGRGPSLALVDCLRGRSGTLSIYGRLAEAAADGGRSLALARELGYPAGEVLALAGLINTACSRDGPPSRVPMRAFTRFGYASAGLAEAVVRDTSTDQSEIEASQGRAVSQAIQLFFSSYGQSGGPPRTVISMAGQCCGSPCALGLPQPPSTARWETQTTRRSAPGRGLMQPKPVYQVRPRALLARKRKIS